MIGANMRTEQLLQQSQGLTQELQTQSNELTIQQEELKRSNSALEKQAVELEEKAKQLEEQNASIEVKNREVELARASLEEKAEQLSLISKYKSEFLANMSHELRTPLNSLLILAKLLADNKDTNLSEKQVEYAKTIYASGGDLLSLINEILDLSKVKRARCRSSPRHPAARPQGLLRAHLPAGGRAEGPAVRDRDHRRAALLHPHRPAAPAAGLEEPARQRLQVHRTGQCPAADGDRARTRQPGVGSPAEGKRRALVLGHRHRDRIPRNKQKIIFEAFQQADGTTSRKYGGTGLGLSISREITRLLAARSTSRALRAREHLHALPARRLRRDDGEEGDDKRRRPGRARAAAEQRERRADPPRAEGSPTPASFLSEVPAPPDEVVLRPIEDDREHLREGDRVLLIIEDDLKFARIMVGMAREKGFKAVVATRATPASRWPTSSSPRPSRWTSSSRSSTAGACSIA